MPAPGVGNDSAKVGALRRPSQPFTGFFRVGYQCWQIYLRYPANPKKINIARLTRTKSAASRCPMRYPKLLFGIVVILSTMSLEIVPSPFWSLGWITIRKSGASLLSLVMAQIVIDSVASKRSS